MAKTYQDNKLSIIKLESGKVNYYFSKSDFMKARKYYREIGTKFTTKGYTAYVILNGLNYSTNQMTKRIIDIVPVTEIEQLEERKKIAESKLTEWEKLEIKKANI